MEKLKTALNTPFQGISVGGFGTRVSAAAQRLAASNDKSIKIW